MQISVFYEMYDHIPFNEIHFYYSLIVLKVYLSSIIFYKKIVNTSNWSSCDTTRKWWHIISTVKYALEDQHKVQ